MVEFAARSARSGKSGVAFIEPASVVSVAATAEAPDESYIELVSGNTFRVEGAPSSVIEKLGL